jgi:hypothetical protein
MQKVMLVALVVAGVGAYTTLAMSAEDLAAAVKERRHLMKDIVAPAAKLGGQIGEGREAVRRCGCRQGDERDQRRSG